MLVWSLPYLLLSLVNGLPIIDSVLLFLFGGYSIYYFIIVIIQCYLILPFLQNRMTTLSRGVCIGIISMICICVLTYVVDLQGPLVLTNGPVFLWLFFFWLGFYLSKNDRTYKISWIIIGCIISFVIMILETKLKIENTGSGYGIKPSSFIFSTLFIILLFSRLFESACNPSNFFNKIIVKIGELSFAIYLIHCFIVVLLSKERSMSFKIS